MSSSSDEDVEATPGFAKNDAKAAMEFPLPRRSKEKYLRIYKDFNRWRAEKKIKTLDECVFITYFQEQSKTKKPSSLWSMYSMLKTTVYSKHKVNLSSYIKLGLFLKHQALGYKSKKTETFTAKQMETFIFEAPDTAYLATKVALIIAISGSCKSNELINIKLENVEKHDQLFLVKLLNHKTKTHRKVVIREEFAKYLQNYMDLRPDGLQCNRFFVHYQQGQCRKQFIGKNKFAAMPKEIAAYLKLPNAKQYTGHCFRSTALLLEKQGGWQSSSIINQIEDSAENRTKEQEMPSTNQKQSETEQIKTRKEAHEILWEINEPIAFEQIDIKEEPLLVSETESINEDIAKQPDSSISTKSLDKGFKQVCSLLGLNPKLPLSVIKKELRQKTAKSVQDTPKAINCTSIFISHMPLWFEFFHVKALIQLKSDFDVESDSYYIDMLKNSENQPTGECLLRFMENKHCLQVYNDIRGVELGSGPIVVNLDSNNKIANQRDRLNPKFKERLRKYNESRMRYKQNCEQELEIGVENITVIKEEVHEESLESIPDEEHVVTNLADDMLSIKSEILQYSVDFENFEQTTCTNSMHNDVASEPSRHNSETALQEPITECNSQRENIKRNAKKITNKEIYPQIEQNVRDKRKDESVSQNYNDHYDTCRIVHIEHVTPGKLYNCINIIQEILREKIGNGMYFQYFPIFDEKTKINATNVLLSFLTHENAEAACKLLNGMTVLGSKIDASMGVGYECKSRITFKDLRKFQRKRKLINADRENEQPAKRARTDDKQSTVDYILGFMPPEVPTDDSYGLCEDFARKLGIKFPFTRRVLVSHLHPEVNEAKLLEVFSLAGEVKQVQFCTSTTNNLQQAKVEYDHPLEAIQAISMLHHRQLYNETMSVRMDFSRTERRLPLGLASVGQGLGTNGEPLRGLRIQAELRRIYESLTDLGAMERITLKKYTPFLLRRGKPLPDPNTTAFKYTYKKRRPTRPTDTNPRSLLKPSETQKSKGQPSTPITYQALQNILSTLPNINTNLNPSSANAVISQPSTLTPLMNSNVSVTQRNAVISAPPKLIIPTNRNVSSAPTNPVTSAPPQLKQANEEPANADPLNEAINRVLELITPNNVTLNMVQSNLAQSIHVPMEALPQSAMPSLAPNMTQILSPRPGCSKEKDKDTGSKHSKYSEETDPRQRSGSEEIYSRLRRDRPKRDPWVRRDPLQRQGSVERETWQRKRSVERDPWPRRESIENDFRQRRSSVERDPWQRRDSIEKDSRQRRSSVERDPWQRRDSIEKDSRQRRSSVERDLRPRKGSVDEDFRERRGNVEKDSGNRYSEERISRHRRESEEKYFRQRDSDDEDSRYSRYDEDRNSRLKRAAKGSYSKKRESEDEDTSCGERDKYSCSKKSNILVFKNLPPSMSSTILSQILGEIGEVLMCEMTESGRAFVRFQNPKDAGICIRLFNHSKVDKQVIEVGYL